MPIPDDELEIHDDDGIEKNETLFSAAQIAHMLQVHRSTVHTWRTLGAPWHNVGGKARFKSYEVIKWTLSRSHKRYDIANRISQRGSGNQRLPGMADATQLEGLVFHGQLIHVGALHEHMAYLTDRVGATLRRMPETHGKTLAKALGVSVAKVTPALQQLAAALETEAFTDEDEADDVAA